MDRRTKKYVEETQRKEQPLEELSPVNGEHSKIWTAIWGLRVDFAGVKTEIRIGLAMMTLIFGAVLGRVIGAF